MKTCLSLNEALKKCYLVGYVYSTGEESYYIDSNLPNNGEWIYARGGNFYCVGHDELPKAYDFYSLTLELLRAKKSFYTFSKKGEDIEDIEAIEDINLL